MKYYLPQRYDLSSLIARFVKKFIKISDSPIIRCCKERIFSMNEEMLILNVVSLFPNKKLEIEKEG
jgi:hypothetical protein